jgi:hypothetical protein
MNTTDVAPSQAVSDFCYLCARTALAGQEAILCDKRPRPPRWRIVKIRIATATFSEGYPHGRSIHLRCRTDPDRPLCRRARQGPHR